MIKDCVLCEVGTKFKYNILINFDSPGRAMSEAASRRPLSAEPRFLSQASPYAFCGGQT